MTTIPPHPDHRASRAFTIGRNVVTPLDCPDSDLADHQKTTWTIAQLQRRHDRPLFLALGLRKPHLLFEVPRHYFEMYPADKIQLPQVDDHDRDDLPREGLRMAGSTEGKTCGLVIPESPTSARTAGSRAAGSTSRDP